MTKLHSPRGLFTAEPCGPDGPLPVTMRAERIYTAGREGSPWSIAILNESSRRMLIRAGVDGKNVLRDEPFSATSGEGYVLAPGASYSLKGWRTSDEDVREFVFTSPRGSAGIPGRQGTIVLAALSERPPEPTVSYADGNVMRNPVAVASAGSADLGTGTGNYLADRVSRTYFDPEPGDPDILVIRYGTPAWLRLQQMKHEQDAAGYGQYETARYSDRV